MQKLSGVVSPKTAPLVFPCDSLTFRNVPPAGREKGVPQILCRISRVKVGENQVILFLEMVQKAVVCSYVIV